MRMHVSPLRAAAVGGGIAVAIVAFVVRPAALVPHPAASPSLIGSPSTAEDAGDTGASMATGARPSAPSRPAPGRTLVYVAGAVAHPGVYALSPDARGQDAVRAAGGFTHDADTVAVNLAAPVADGDEIAVPKLGDETATRATRRTFGAARAKKHRAKHGRRGRSDAAAGDAPRAAIDLNRADAAALATIPGIGPTLAARIVAFRAVNGPFASVDGLADVAGITPSRFDAIAAHLTVTAP
jgi:competence protein ComEA